MLIYEEFLLPLFGVNLEHASLNQSFLPTNQHCFRGEGGGRREREDSPELLKMLWSFSKISLFVRVPTNFGQDCRFPTKKRALLIDFWVLCIIVDR